MLYISFSARLVHLDSTFIFGTLDTTSEAPYTPCKTKHRAAQTQTITTSTPCAMWVGTPLVLQPRQPSRVCGIAVDLDRHKTANTYTWKLPHTTVVSTARLSIHFTTRSHKTAFHTALAASIAQHISWHWVPALCPTRRLMYKQVSSISTTTTCPSTRRLGPYSTFLQNKANALLTCSITCDRTHYTQTTCLPFKNLAISWMTHHALEYAVSCNQQFQFRQLPLPPTPQPLVLPLFATQHSHHRKGHCFVTWPYSTNRGSHLFTYQSAILQTANTPHSSKHYFHISGGWSDFCAPVACCSKTKRLWPSGLLCVQNPVSKGLQLTIRNQPFSESFD